MHKLVDFSGQLVVLMGHYANVIVHRVDLNLQIGIALQQHTVVLLRLIELSAHEHQVVVGLTDAKFNFLYLASQINILAALHVNSLLNVRIFFFIALFQTFEVGEFTNEAIELILKAADLTLTIVQLLFQGLNVVTFGFDFAVKFLHAVKRLRDFELQVTQLGIQLLSRPISLLISHY
jgi:hypothetical protein